MNPCQNPVLAPTGPLQNIKIEILASRNLRPLIGDQIMPEMAAWTGEPNSLRVAIWETGKSPDAKAAPKPMEMQPIIARLTRATRSIGMSATTPMSNKTLNNGEKIDAKSPSTITIAVSTALPKGPSNIVVWRMSLTLHCRPVKLSFLFHRSYHHLYFPYLMVLMQIIINY